MDIHSIIDESLYLLKDGTRPLTGNWPIGGFDISDIGNLYLLEDGTIGISGGPSITFDTTAGNNVAFNSAIIATGTYGSGWTEPNLGAGARMMWYPRKSAFRVGSVDSTQWDNANIGAYSFVIGTNSTASGLGGYTIGVSNTNASIAGVCIGAGNASSGAGEQYIFGIDITADTALGSFSIGEDFTNSTANSIALGLFGIDMLITQDTISFEDCALSGSGDYTTTGDIIIDSNTKGIILGDDNDIKLIGNSTANTLVIGSVVTLDTANKRVGIDRTPTTYQLEMEGTACGVQFIRVNEAAAARGVFFLMQRMRGSVGSYDDVVDGDQIGKFLFGGWHTNNAYNAAEIEAVIDGTPGAGDMPGRLNFKTSADGSSTPTTRLTIGPDGTVGVTGDVTITNDGTQLTLTDGTYSVALRSSLTADDILYVVGVASSNINLYCPNGGRIVLKFEDEDDHIQIVPGGYAATYFYEDVIDNYTPSVRVYGFPTGESKVYGQFQIVSGTTTPRFQISTTGEAISIPEVVYLGDGGTTNFSEFEADGTLVFHGAATVFDDIRIVPGSFDRPGVSDPAYVAYDVNGGGVNTYLTEWAKNDIASFTIQIPHSYDEGEDMDVHLHWTPGPNGAGENGATVGWKIQYSWANADGSFGNMITADLSDACDGTNHKHQMTPTVAVTGTSKTISSMLVCNITRTDTGADDTWAGVGAGNLPMLLEVDFHFPKDTIGSRQILTK